jgi:cytoskeletal protein CcmA (bactofilin family)
MGSQKSGRDEVVAERCAFDGAAPGSVEVIDGGDLLLTGTVEGDVTVHPGGRAEIRGTVEGEVVNLGGTVEVHGTVGAVLSAAGETWIAPNATVRRP